MMVGVFKLPLESRVGVRFTLKWFDSSAQIPEEIWYRCFGPGYEGYWWYHSLDTCGISEQFQFSYGLILQDDEKPVGIVPTFLMDLPMDLVAPKEIMPVLKVLGILYPSLLHQRTYFIGSPCGQEGHIGLIDGVHLEDVAYDVQCAAWARASKFKAQMLSWKDFPEYDQPALNKLSVLAGLFRVISYPETRVTLPTGGINEYYQSIKQRYRYKLKKKLRRSKESLKVTSEIATTLSAADLERIFVLYFQTYQKGKTKLEKLTIKFFESIAAQNPVRWILLRRTEDQEIVAFMLCFELEGRIINKFIGLDYSQPAESFLYFRLWEAAVEWALSTGKPEFYSGQTGYSAKIDVGNSLIPLMNYCRHTNLLLNKIYANVAASISWKGLDEDLARYIHAHPELDCTLRRAIPVASDSGRLIAGSISAAQQGVRT